jgi:hypothetical protein
MCIDRFDGGWLLHRRRSVETPRRKFKHRLNLLPRYIVLLDDFLNARTSSRFSNTVATGIRVSRNTHAPLRLSGTLSTAGHCDQSSVAVAMLCTPSLRIRYGGGLRGYLGNDILSMRGLAFQEGCLRVLTLSAWLERSEILVPGAVGNIW